nr:immunoglobulin light chain junction region [Macaca mulatta]MOY04270.1 immunoglobulin light chain junction region [Macaca mulatta]
CQQCSIVPFSF